MQKLKDERSPTQAVTQFLKDLGLFVVVAAPHWFFAARGGAFTALITAFARVVGANVPTWLYVSNFVVGGVFFAAFNLWRIERRARLKAETQLAGRKEAQEIFDLIREAREVAAKYDLEIPFGPNLILNPLLGGTEKANERKQFLADWTSRVKAVIQTLGPAINDRFDGVKPHGAYFGSQSDPETQTLIECMEARAMLAARFAELRSILHDLDGGDAKGKNIK